MKKWILISNDKVIGQLRKDMKPLKTDFNAAFDNVKEDSEYKFVIGSTYSDAKYDKIYPDQSYGTDRRIKIDRIII